jgi:hypothetical protein
MTGRPVPRGSPRRVVIAAIRTRAGRPGLRTASCVCCVLLGILVGLTPTAGAHLTPLPVLVQASFSDGGGSPSVKVAIRSAARAKCQVAVDVAKRRVLLPVVTADTRGRVVATWQVPAGTPSGRWAFDVSCAKGRRAGRGSDHAVVLLPAVSIPSSADLDTPPLSITSAPGSPEPGSPALVSGATAGVPSVSSEGPSVLPAEPPPVEPPPAEPPPVEPLHATLPPTPATPEPASLESILPQARQIMAQPGTVWSKAAAVRNLVRASLSDQNDCGVMAMAFWSVGSIVGLPLRLVDSSANGQNAFDTHATVEVWLAGLGRWAISDPTFNGYWSVGPNGTPVSAVLLQSAVRAGTNTTLYWHGANTPNSLLPSQYYVDPTFLYPYIDFLAFVPDVGTAFMVASEADAFSFPYALIPTASADFESMPPDTPTAVSLDERTQAPSPAGVSESTLPPRYAETLVYQGQITFGPDRRATIPVANPGTAAVVSVETGAGNWQLEVGGGTTYDLDPYPEARLSPIVFLGAAATLIADEAPPEPVTVRVWTVKLFPASRETTSQWEGA